jgi:hypothetical protein
MVRCGWALRFVHGCLRDCVHGYVYICCVDVCVCVFMRTVIVRVMCAYVLLLFHIIVVRVDMRVLRADKC